MITKVVLIILIAFIFCIRNMYSYKILGVFPYPAPSHYFLGNELMKGLAMAGHDVTILTVFEEKHPPNKNYKQIVLEGLHDTFQASQGAMTNINHDTAKTFFSNPLKTLRAFFKIINNVTELTLSHSRTQKLIKSKQKFDVVIVTQIGLESLKALAPHFGAHLVLFSNHGGMTWTNHFVGIPSLPSLNSEIIFGYIGQMNFQQRLTNTLFTMVSYMILNGALYPHHVNLVHQYISEDLDLNQILYNVSLVLSNSHTSVYRAAASVPTVKDIAGFHVKPPKKLPEELQKYLNDAKGGVIYFSMGSMVKSADFTAERRNIFIKAFSKRKEKILWKFESNLTDIPDNVRMEKWFPQSDLLAHPNIKLFITHGGLLSTIETVYNGIPTIALPVIADQLQNSRQSEHDGYCKVLEYKTLTEEILSSAIEELIANKKYLENVKSRSKIFHDRPIKPMDEAVYWVEYVVRHNGAHHLRVGYIDLAWYQYYLLDVFGVIFCFLLLALFLIRKTVCFIFSKFCSKNKNMKIKLQ